MAVYVDNFSASFRGMIMCHMTADTRAELFAMVDRIGVDRKHLQNAGTPTEHFDISRSKRAEAVKAGAVEITTRTVGWIVIARRQNLSAWIAHYMGMQDEPQAIAAAD